MITDTSTFTDRELVSYTNMASLRERAARAHTDALFEYQQEEEEQKARELLTTCANLRRHLAGLGLLDEATIDTATGRATIDGLLFTAGNRYLYLLAPCSQCGVLLSTIIHDLADIGEALPHLDRPEATGLFDTDLHRHPRPQPTAPPALELTDQERDLVIAVRALLHPPADDEIPF